MPKCHWLPLLGPMHFGISFAALVLRQAGRGYQRGIHRRAFLEQIAFGTELRVDSQQKLLGQLLPLQQMAKAQNTD